MPEHPEGRRRGKKGAQAQRDWWALAWLRGTEIATDALWSRSRAVSRPGAKLALWGAGVSNLSMALGFAWLARSR